MAEEADQPELDLEDKIEVAQDDEPSSNGPKKAEDPEKQELSPEEGIEHLKKRLEEAEKAKIEAQKQAWEANQKAVVAEKNVQDGDYQIIVGAIKQTKQNGDILKQAYAQAAAVQDWARLADIQEAMAINTNKLSTLENGKVALENKLKQPIQPVQPLSNDPVEKFASQLTPASAEWVRAHPEVIKDPVKYQKMLEGHNYAVGVAGIMTDTPQYFDAVEKFIGLNQAPLPEPDYEEPTHMAAQVTQKRTQAPPAAPSTRVASNNSGKPQVVRLSADQKEMASMMGMSPEDYAKNMVALKREGRLN